MYIVYQGFTTAFFFYLLLVSLSSYIRLVLFPSGLCGRICIFKLTRLCLQLSRQAASRVLQFYATTRRAANTPDVPGGYRYYYDYCCCYYYYYYRPRRPPAARSQYYYHQGYYLPHTKKCLDLRFQI